MLKPLWKKLFQPTVVILIITTAVTAPAWADSRLNNSAEVIQITPEMGHAQTNRALSVRVWSGRVTLIDFSQVKERITNVIIGDPSRLTYTADTNIESGNATTLFLRQIKRLNFPDATTASLTNLAIKTINSRGEQRLYVFNVLPADNSPNYSGLTVTHSQPKPDSWEVGYTRPATLDDIEAGIQVAIDRQYAEPNEPLFTRVKEFIANARNGTPIREAAKNSGVSLAVITELGKLGIEGRIQ